MKKIFSLIILLTLFSAPAFADWSPWNSLGGGIIGDPAACTSRNVSYVAVKGTDYAIWYRKKVLSQPNWEDWKRIPGGLTFTGSPSLTCRRSGSLDIFEVFAIANYRNIYRNRLTSMGFTGWNNFSTFGIPTQLAFESGAASPRANSGQRPYLLVRGSDNYVYYSRCLRSMVCNQRWSPVAGTVVSDPTAIFRTQNKLDFIVQTSFGRLIHQNIRNGVAYYYGQISGGPVTSAPDLVSRSSNSLDLFARGPSGTLLHKRWINGTWGIWNDLGGIATSGPGATTFANKTRMMVFVRGTDGALWYRTWSPF